MVRLTIDGRPCEAAEGTTILKAAESLGIKIPTLCYWEGINDIGACRICVVEAEGLDRLISACNSRAEDGMVIYTDSPRVRASRKFNLQLLLAKHDCHCPTCVRNGNCELQTLAEQFNVHFNPFKEEIPQNSWDMSAPFIRAASKCIKCMRCIQVCDKIQGAGIWDVLGTGTVTTVGVHDNLNINSVSCAYCGQCVTHCPTGALTERDDTRAVLDNLADPAKITVVQIAPAIRAAWGEDLGMDRDTATMGRLASTLRQMGFDYVFDTNFTADLTIMEEGSEFLQRFKNKEDYQWPMFTSCCPGWIRYIKSRYPEFTANLSTAKSPQQMFGAVTKTYFTEKIGVDPKDLFLVSVMPCIAKKSEAELPTMKSALGDKPDVDAVITTRELVRLIKSEHIDPSVLPESKLDSPLGTGTGAAVIFGATGGVMDAALRSAYYLLTGKNPDPDSFVKVRGMDGWKEAVFSIPSAGDVRVAVASGLGNAGRLLDAVKDGRVSYDFVEIMACPGGCAGGGGQPIHPGEEFAQVRGDHLWRMDKDQAIRFSHENPDVQALYSEYFGQPLGERSHHLLHTDHFAWDMPETKKENTNR